MSRAEKSFAGADSISFPLVFQGPWHVRYTRSGVMVSSPFVIFFSHSKLITSFCQALIWLALFINLRVWLTQGYPRDYCHSSHLVRTFKGSSQFWTDPDTGKAMNRSTLEFAQTLGNTDYILHGHHMFFKLGYDMIWLIWPWIWVPYILCSHQPGVSCFIISIYYPMLVA